ncbi:NUDIX domain-containing protein [Halovenus sp. WSH3]|uniref:NUDIX domain-containing protein n=1 Tax=Halovenus carboxidivorans TaxID=2692199 RepID=A0A6B0T547_9EURY|nr:NUDIX domain-containing protein [Halovenus carboxidivorans]MXR52087.1 NUDIX domain-containing protein [Halovenus carboxidivorans]
MDEREVVTGFLRNDGEILLLQRSEDVGSYRGRWGGIAGHVEDHAEDEDPYRGAIRAEIREETGLDPDLLSLVRSGDAFSVADSELDVRWVVRPFLFDCPTRTVDLDWEHTAAEWVPATAILDRETVLRLWDSYDRVRPTVETVESDREHGSAYLSVRALEVLRDEAGLLARGDDRSTADDVRALARALLDARPSMTVLANRISRVTDTAGIEPGAVESAAIEEISRAVAADERAAKQLRPRLDGARIATLSRSGTVVEALQTADPAAVLLPESRPGREAIEVAEALSPDLPVTLTTDAAFPGQLESWGADGLVVGADAVLPDGSVRNKVGTRPAAAVAARAGIPVVVCAAVDKIAPSSSDEPEPRPSGELYDGDPSITARNPTFERTPPDLIDAYATDRGDLDTAEIRSLAEEFEKRRTDSDDPD